MRIAAAGGALLAAVAFAGCVGGDGDAPPRISCPQWVTPTFTMPDGSPGEQALLVANHQFYFNRTTQHIGPHADGGPVQGSSEPYDPHRHGLGANRLGLGGRPLDVIRVELALAPPGHGIVDGTVQVTATAADGAALAFHPDGPHHGEPTYTLELPAGAANRTLYVPLADAAGEAAPQPIRTDWLFLPDDDGDVDTASWAVVQARYVPQYRNWSGSCVDGEADAYVAP